MVTDYFIVDSLRQGLIMYPSLALNLGSSCILRAEIMCKHYHAWFNLLLIAIARLCQ